MIGGICLFEEYNLRIFRIPKNWTEDELLRLFELRVVKGIRNFSALSEYFPGYSSSQLRSLFYRVFQYDSPLQNSRVHYWNDNRKILLAFLWAFESNDFVILKFFPGKDRYILRANARKLCVKRMSKVIPDQLLHLVHLLPDHLKSQLSIS